MTNERRSQSITVSAKTVTEAIAEAEQRLGLRQDEIDITVISEGSKGFLGMGGENARILAMPKAILSRRTVEPARPVARRSSAPPPAAPEDDEADFEPEATTLSALPAVPEAPMPQESTLPAISEPLAAAVESMAPVEETPEDLESQAQAARVDPAQVAQEAVGIVRELLARMGIEAQATVRSVSNPVVIDIQGSDLGLLIGRHGDTLSSLQYLVNALVGKRVHRWCKVVVDVEQYRSRREDTLRSLANRQAARVRQNQREIVLDPMPAAERRIIHLTLQSSPWVVTNSVGDEPTRKVVIAPRQGPR